MQHNSNCTIIEGGRRTRGFTRTPRPEQPVISIITVVYNGARHIENAIKSVLGQCYENVEYIIIDGASTDNTLEIIRRYDDQIDYWLSEPDQGISDAFNKGVFHCHGKIIGTLNADDSYLPNILRLVAKTLITGEEDQILHGSMIGVWSNKSTVIRPRPCPKLYVYFDTPYFHSTTFIPASIYEKIGRYDPEYGYAMDYDLFLRAQKAGVKFHEINAAITRYSFEGKSGSNPLSAYREVLKSQRRNGLFYPLCLTTYMLKTLANRLKKFLF
ncbi:MAG: glycosyltransferase [Proteobacteria bacterium]|nr:glycosyltransferase [Pseudomonadota bacterium]MBU1738248.1 glycosyltransferase [Pseudomonadota bacterium]